MFRSAHLNREFASAHPRLFHGCPRLQWHVQEQGAACVLWMVLRHISKEAELRHHTNSLVFNGCSSYYFMSPRFSEVLFSRGRHPQMAQVYINNISGHWIFLLKWNKTTTTKNITSNVLAAVTLAQGRPSTAPCQDTGLAHNTWM